jgi:spermidine/putrescine ABC transporter ATP-binding subunit
MIDSKPAVLLKNVSKSFGEVHAVHSTTLQIMQNEFFSILGPSGCGKTTLMRLIAGFESADSGSIELSGQDVTKIPTRNRDLNMLFQNYALFPHLSVFENVAFELRVRKVPRDDIQQRVHDSLKLVQMEGLEKRLPDQLSGGQKQRVALARAIVGKPSVILLDEPLGALDKQLRKDMQFELKRLQREVGCTFVYVTHDQEEALSMSDRIAVMRSGEIHQIGTPQEIYNNPQTMFVATFIGDCNLLDGKVNAQTNTYEVAGLASLPILQSDSQKQDSWLMVRPEKINLSSVKPQNFSLEGTVSEANYLGDEWKVRIRVTPDIEILVSSSSSSDLQIGLRDGIHLWVSWDVEDQQLIRRS